MRRRAATAVLLAVSIGAGAISAPALADRPRPVPPRIVTLHYYGPSLAGYPGLTWNGGNPPTSALGDGGVGAVLLPLRSGDLAVSLVPKDDSGQVIGATAYFIGRAQESLTSPVSFCGRSRRLPVPARAASLRVSLDPTVCPGLVTTGTVTATITQRQTFRRT